MRPLALLLLCVVFALGASSTSALQVGTVASRSNKSRLHQGREPSRFSAVRTTSSTRSETPSSGFLTQLRSSFVNDSRDVVDPSSRRDRLALLRWPILAALLALATTTLAPTLHALFQSYNQCLTTRPLLTKVLTGAVLATLGDALAQAGKPYDSRRAASFAMFDSCYRMFQHMAFPLIIGNCRGRVLSGILSAIPGLATTSVERLIPILAVSERVLTYQMMVVPLLYYPVFFTFTGFMQGLSIKGTYQRAVANFLPCWKRNLMFWIPIQAVMFGFVPEKFQVAFTCVMGIIWSLILSITAGKAKADH